MPHIYEDKISQLDLKIEELFTSLITFPPEHANTMQARKEIISLCTLQNEQRQALHHCNRLDMKYVKQEWQEKNYIINHLFRKMENYLDIKRAINQNYPVKIIMNDLTIAQEHAQKAIELVNQHCYLNAPRFIHHAREIKGHIKKPHLYFKNQLEQAQYFFNKKHISLKEQFEKTFHDPSELPPNLELININIENKTKKNKK
jgi:hypothetical protein